MHSGDSANASSALQLLDTSVPDHAPDDVAEFVAWVPELLCPAIAKEIMEKSATRQGKQRFAAESALAVSINSRSSFPS